MTCLPQLICLQSHSNYLSFHGPMEYDISIFAVLTFLKIPSIWLLLNNHIFNECFASVLNIPLFSYTGIYVFRSLLIVLSQDVESANELSVLWRERYCVINIQANASVGRAGNIIV